jgi:hypothetical protein
MIETIIAALLLVALLILAGCRTSVTSANPEAPAQSANSTTSGKTGEDAKAELQRRLNQLARSAPPKDLKMGAMCYDTAGPANRIDFICPHCGSRTAYANPPWDAGDGSSDELRRRFVMVTFDIPQCRDLIKKIDGLESKLDESELCATCCPKVEKPSLILTLRPQAGADIRRIRDITPDDLRVLAAFLNGKDRWEGEQEWEHPVKDRLQRLAEILGLEVPPTP